MFRARDSCGADVRRGRSPKCLFINATATGNTINGLNDEINKPSEAGHGGAWLELRWPGCHHWAEPQVCLQARSLPAPAALPAPQTPESPSVTRTRCLSLPLGTSRSFLTTKVATSLSPHGPQMCQVNARLGVYFNFSSQGPELTLQPAQRGPFGGCGSGARQAFPPPHTSSQDTLSNS